MKKLLFLTLLCITIFDVKAQRDGSGPVASYSTYSIDLPPGQNKIVLIDSRPNLDGSPYLYDDWASGQVFFNNGDTIKSILLRYNVYKDEMQFQNEGKAYSVGSPEKIMLISMNNHSFIYQEYNEKEKKRDGFFELIYGGKSSLLQRHLVKILPANFNIALNSGNKNDQISMTKMYYFKYNDDIIPIEKNGKNVIAFLKGKGIDVQKFVKENKLSFKKEEDLIKFTKYLDSI